MITKMWTTRFLAIFASRFALSRGPLLSKIPGNGTGSGSTAVEADVPRHLTEKDLATCHAKSVRVASTHRGKQMGQSRKEAEAFKNSSALLGSCSLLTAPPPPQVDWIGLFLFQYPSSLPLPRGCCAASSS